MAGTIVAGNISDGSNSVDTETVAKGSAKAWVNFNNVGTAVIRGSFNVSSITENGTGNFTVNFTNPMSDNNYALSFSLGYDGSASSVNTNSTIEVLNKQSASVQIFSGNHAGGLFDFLYNDVIIYR